MEEFRHSLIPLSLGSCAHKQPSGAEYFDTAPRSLGAFFFLNIRREI